MFLTVCQVTLTTYSSNRWISPEIKPRPAWSLCSTLTVWYASCFLLVVSKVWQVLSGHTVGLDYKRKPHTFGLCRAHLHTCMGRFNPVRKMIQARLCPFRCSTSFDTNSSLKSPKITIITCLLLRRQTVVSESVRGSLLCLQTKVNL
jgi:hypothetical protein